MKNKWKKRSIYIHIIRIEEKMKVESEIERKKRIEKVYIKLL